MDIYPDYIVNRYKVDFISEEEVPGWASNEDGKFIFSTEMNYGAYVTFWAKGVQIDEGANSFVIGTENNVVTLPAIPLLNGVIAGTWGEPVINSEGATFTAVYDLDTIVYHSGEVPFSYAEGGDAVFTAQTVQYAESSPLIVPLC